MRKATGLCLLLAFTAPAHAASLYDLPYTYSIAFNGSTAVSDGLLDPTIRDPNLQPFGTTVVHTVGNAVWQVTAPQPELLYWLGYDTTLPGSSSGTTATFYLDGARVAQFSGTDLAPNPGTLYKGANRLAPGLLPVGFVFDAVLVSVLTGGGGIKPGSDVLGGDPFFRNSAFAYLTEPPLAATPIPPALVLFASALAGLGLLGRKAARHA